MGGSLSFRRFPIKLISVPDETSRLLIQAKAGAWRRQLRPWPEQGAPMIWEQTKQRESCVQKGHTAMAAKRICYVNYNPATLIRDEQLLMRAGYEVDTVFGTDGFMACGPVTQYTSVLIDEACPPEDRKKLIRWLAANFPKLDILSAAWLHKRAVRR
jgi:hypothetical protein